MPLSAILTTRAERQKRWSIVLVWLVIAVYTVFFAWFSIERSHNFNAGWYDLGIMAQTVWRMGHSFNFTFTNPELGPGGVHGWMAWRTSIHADYLLALLAPLSWWKGHTADLLLIVQSAVVALGGWFVFRIARREIGHWAGVLLALCFLAYPPLHFATFFEFHAVTLSITFFLAAADAMLGKKYRWWWFWVALALLTKEQAGITLGLLGAWLAWRQKNKRMALWALAIPWAWAILQIAVIIPASRPDLPASFAYKFFPDASPGFSGVVTQFAHPSTIVHKLITAVHLHSAFELAAPLGLFAPLLSPFVLLATPEVLLYWLSDSPNMQTVVLHYHALFIPFLFLSTILGWRWLVYRMGRRRWMAHGVMALSVFIGSISSTAFFSPLTSSSEQNRWPLVQWKERLAPEVARAFALIPNRADAAFTQNLGPLMAERPVAQLLPNGVKSVHYIFILERQFDPTLNTNDKRLAEKVMLDRLTAWLDNSIAYRQLYHHDRVFLYQRIGDDPWPLPVWPDGLLGQ